MYVLITGNSDQVLSPIVCLVAEKPISNAKHRTSGGCTLRLCQSFNANRFQIVPRPTVTALLRLIQK